MGITIFTASFWKAPQSKSKKEGDKTKGRETLRNRNRENEREEQIFRAGDLTRFSKLEKIGKSPVGFQKKKKKRIKVCTTDELKQ